MVGLKKDDYRIRDGGLEVRVQSGERRRDTPMLKVTLPFGTSETVTASVEATIVGEPLGRNEFAGLFLFDADGPSFTVRKTNIDGYFLLAPGEVDFIGKPGEEGNPGKYTVKYWPADEAAGRCPLLSGNTTHTFRSDPPPMASIRTFFHSAIQNHDEGMGFGLMTAGSSGDTSRWVRFDNFRVWRN